MDPRARLANAMRTLLLLSVVASALLSTLRPPLTYARDAIVAIALAAPSSTGSAQNWLVSDDREDLERAIEPTVVRPDPMRAHTAPQDVTYETRSLAFAPRVRLPEDSRAGWRYQHEASIATRRHARLMVFLN